MMKNLGVLQLRSWSHGLLALHDLPDLYDLYGLYAFLLVLQPSALVGLWRRYNFEPLNWCDIQDSSPGKDFQCARKAVIYQYPFGRPIPTSTLCKADIYQYVF